MASAISTTTPLLNSFRAATRKRAQIMSCGPWFGSLLTVLACLMVVAICWYLASVEPLFEFKSVEFTHPDLVVCIILLAVVARGVITGFHALPKALLLPFLIFFGATLLSTAFAVDKVHGLAAIIQELEFVALAWAFSLVTDRKSFLRILHFILLVFVIQSLIAAWQFIVMDKIMPTGTFGHHQQYSFYTSSAAVIAFGLLVSEQTKSKRALYLLVTPILLMGCLLGQERATWLSFVIGALAVVWYSGRKRKRLLIAFAATMLGAVLLVVSIRPLREATIDRITAAEASTARENSLLSRLIMWKIAFDMFTQHPILGVGPKNFQVLVPHYASRQDMQGNEKEDAHNIWIQMLAEQGIVGFVTYVIFVWSIVRLATTELRSPGLPASARPLCFAYIGFFFFWLAMSYPFFLKGIGHIQFLIIGLMLGLRHSLSTQRSMGLSVPLSS